MGALIEARLQRRDTEAAPVFIAGRAVVLAVAKSVREARRRLQPMSL